jgi:hypothetical protein
MKKFLPLVVIGTLISTGILAQQDVYLTINHKLADESFAFNQASTNNLGHNFSITRVDYYMSKFTIIHDGGMETEAPGGTYILAKGSSSVSALLGNFNVTTVEGIKLHVGVNAPVNNEDPTQWLAPHPLAPQSPSMHWGWTAGYRFVALEGKAGPSLTTTFQMHSLGNFNYFEQTIIVNAVENEGALYINLNADYTEAVKNINLNAGPIDHGVNATDLTVLENFRDFVFSAASGTTSINNNQNEISLSLFPNPSSGMVQINWENNGANITDLVIFDITGKKIQASSLRNQSSISLSIEKSGMYMVQLLASGEIVANRKLFIE